MLAFTPALDGSGENLWPHLWHTVLPHQIQTTLILMIGVGFLATAIGTGAAWLVSLFTFPGVRFLSYALALPLALPTYIVAYAYGELLDSASSIYQIWRAILPVKFYPDIHNLAGAIILLSLVLYPYVYFAARIAFLRQSAQLIDTARILGASPARCFWQIALPLARPAIIAGTILVLMETLNDIGAVEFLGVHTLTYGVYTTWLTRGSLSGAAQIALMLLALIIILIMCERITRRQRGFATVFTHRLPRLVLRGRQAFAAVVLCCIPIAFGFVIPVLQLLDYARDHNDRFAWASALTNSLSMATISAGGVIIIALFLGHIARTGTRFDGRLVRSTGFGYAVPGTILGLAVLLTIHMSNIQLGGVLILISGVAALVFAYLVRFMTMGINIIEAGYVQIPRNFDIAARSLGSSRGGLLWRIHGRILLLPMSIASLLVFVETLKELPATLILRPFDFETLAIHVHTHANLGRMETASIPALIIIAAGTLAVFISFRLQKEL